MSSTEKMVLVPLSELQRLQENMDPHRGAVAWGIVCTLLEQPAIPHQGEPVAVMYANGSVLTKADCGDSFEICCKVETPLYTHADAGDVERLTRKCQNADLALKVQTQNCDRLRAWGKANAGLAQTCMDELETRRAQLDERDALINRAVQAWAAADTIKDMHAAMAALRDILSTSAEQSEPVERDELIAAVHVLRSQGFTNLAESVEAARAVLERKPITQVESLYEKGRRLCREGFGASCLWGECKSDDELPEVHRGWRDEFNARSAIERKP